MGNLTETAHEQAYRDFFLDEGNVVITLGDLLDAVNETPEVKKGLDDILAKENPITILLEGSAFVQNLDAVNRLISSRDNPSDRVILIDTSEKAVSEHQQYVADRFPGKNYFVVRGDMNALPIASYSVDLVINDCAINYNTTTEENQRTLGEFRRVMKPHNSAVLLSLVVSKELDSPQYGMNQENTPVELVDMPSVFYPIIDHSLTRTSWSNPHYKRLISEAGFRAVEYDIETGKTAFPEESNVSYRRFFLTGGELE